MAAAPNRSGVFGRRPFNVAHQSDTPAGADAPSVPLTKPLLASFAPSLPVINRLLGALADLPPSAWLFV